jgi:hypothetical protein
MTLYDRLLRDEYPLFKRSNGAPPVFADEEEQAMYDLCRQAVQAGHCVMTIECNNCVQQATAIRILTTCIKVPPFSFYVGYGPSIKGLGYKWLVRCGFERLSPNPKAIIYNQLVHLRTNPAPIGTRYNEVLDLLLATMAADLAADRIETRLESKRPTELTTHIQCTQDLLLLRRLLHTDIGVPTARLLTAFSEEEEGSGLGWWVVQIKYID